MKYLLLILSALTLTACASGFQTVQIREVDPELEIYVSEFERIYNLPITYRVKIGKLGKSKTNGVERQIVGQCSGRRDEVIILDTYYEYYKNNYNAMEQLVFHELGHCSLGLGHNEELTPDGYPKSIMYPTVFSGYFGWLNNYEDHKHEYYEELAQ